MAKYNFQFKLGVVQDYLAGNLGGIDRMAAKHGIDCGYRRVTAAIRQMGYTINHKTVQRLMKQLQLKSLVRPKKYRSYNRT